VVAFVWSAVMEVAPVIGWIKKRDLSILYNEAKKNDDDEGCWWLMEFDMNESMKWKCKEWESQKERDIDVYNVFLLSKIIVFCLLGSTVSRNFTFCLEVLAQLTKYCRNY
jgi:hypothetical protein